MSSDSESVASNDLTVKNNGKEHDGTNDKVIKEEVKDDRVKDKKSKDKKKRRSRSKSSSRSRSRSRSRERGRKRGRRSMSRSTYSRSLSPGQKRLHVADLDSSVRRRDVEDAFTKYGRLTDLWVASYPPYYAFVVFEKSDDARTALKDMKNGYIRNCPIRTSIALPRGGPRRDPPRRSYDDRDRRRDRSRSRTPKRKRSSSPRRKRSSSRSS